MKAVVQHKDQLSWDEVSDLYPKRGEIRIAVHASAVNRADLSQRAGGYPPPPGASSILGLECSGVVDKVGEGVTSIDLGDRVCALLSGGGYAENVTVPAGQVLRIPGNIGYDAAAALPEVFATAYLNLYMEARLQPGETVLIHAGGSGVGTSAIQLCKSFQNPCFVTAGSREKVLRCQELGASSGCVRSDEDFVGAVTEWTQSKGVDVILDPVGASYFEKNLKVLATDGRLVVIGLMGGGDTEIALGRLMVKRQRVIGSTLRARPIAAKAQVMDELKKRVWPLIESGEIQPIIDRILPIEQVDEAHKLIASNSTFGKVVLRVRS
ncbi:MAG: NAD(P)H-quinone oxidoreductase [Gammaproteobacteria bacterium]|nr:NAD(P)H-quinone oxidoreductase [Gammaproteobacteria bacterium]MYD80116.1 NAD(P)H-quinone oxidoreductase [Gammaproteobacteria bacterium]